jgi:hypothetical protein
MRYTPPNPSYRLEDHMHRLMLPGQKTYPEHTDGQMGGNANAIRSDRNFTNQKSSEEQLHDQRGLRTESSLADFPRGRVQYKTTRDVRAWGVKGYLRNLMKTSHTIYLACGFAVLGVCAGVQTPKTQVPVAESRPAPKGAFAKEIGDLEARYDRADWRSPELILQGLRSDSVSFLRRLRLRCCECSRSANLNE